jgi:hypothetical protein
MATKFPLKEFLVEFLTKNLPSLLLASFLFGGGIILLFLKIPGWSLFLGLPAVQIGIILLIFTFEGLTRKKSPLPSEEYHLVDCLICDRQALAPKFMEKRICDDCQVKIAQRLKAALVTIYLLVTIPLTLALVQKNQELRKKALEITPTPTPTLIPQSP